LRKCDEKFSLFRGRTNVIKMLFTVAMAEADRERLRRYVPESHAPLVVSVRAAADSMYRYVPHLSIRGKADTAFGLPIREDFCNVVEMLHESIEAMVASRQDKEFQEKILPDEQKMGGNFNDILIFFVKEVEIVKGPSWPITLYHFLKRREGLTREECQGRWKAGQSSLIGVGGPQDHIRRYVQNHVLPAGSIPFGTDDGGFDIIDEYHFETLEDIAAFKTADLKLAERIAEGHRTLTDQGRSFAVLSQGITFIERPGRSMNA
jgi:hypothetical protein